MISIQMQEVNSMIKYQDLCEKYKSSMDKARNNQKELADLVNALKAHIEDSLDLHDKTWKEVNGKSHSYLEIKKANNEKKLETVNAISLPFQFSKEQATLDFFFSLAIEEAENSFPKQLMTVHMNAIKKDDKFSIGINKASNEFIYFDVNVDDKDSLNMPCEYFKQALLDFF